MFGDNYIAFRQTVAIDKKNRMIIPSQTGVEKDETLYLHYNIQRTCLVISKATYILQRLDELKKELSVTKDIEQLKQISEVKDYYSSLILQVLRVDPQKRIRFDKRIKDSFLGNLNQVFLSGQDDAVNIYRDEEECNKGLYGQKI